jgi:hypothetical protein
LPSGHQGQYPVGIALRVDDGGDRPVVRQVTVVTERRGVDDDDLRVVHVNSVHLGGS